MFFFYQIQRLIHMLLENLSSLLESLVGINQTTKPQEATLSSVDDLIPSLPKLRVLAGMRHLTRLLTSGQVG